jgi:hypothetical protein
MQLGSVYLYPNRLEVYTNLDAWLSERYRKVYQRNIKVYKGVDNKIEFSVKNSDQKPLRLTSQQFVFSLISVETQELILSKDCILDTPAIGRIVAIISKEELLGLEKGLYNYSLRFEKRQTIDQNSYQVTESGPVYVDSQYGAIGVLDVLGDVEGTLTSSFEIKEFKSYVEPWRDRNFSVSTIIDTNSQLVTAKTLHTFQFFFNNYTGRVKIQGSLDQGGNPQNWTDLQIYDYIGVDREYANVVGKYNWLRIDHTPNVKGLIGAFNVTQTIFFSYSVEINEPGRAYQVGNIIVIKGNRLGGKNIVNDLTITVEAVNLEGGITSISWIGSSYNGTATFTVGGNAIPNSGTFDKILYR